MPDIISVRTKKPIKILIVGTTQIECAYMLDYNYNEIHSCWLISGMSEIKIGTT